MSRGIGEFAPIQDAIPEWAAVLIALVTQLGDTWFLALFVGLLYWFYEENREDAAVIVGFTVAGLALIGALKHVFGLPRPQEPLVRLEALPWVIQPLYDATASAGGYGFPSGHALMTTIVYFGLAHRLPIATRRRRFAGAALVVGAVCFSRVALGVHYLVDVVAGVGVGIAFLVGAELLLNRVPTDQGTVAFAVAVVLSAIDLLVGGVDGGGAVLFGTALGAFGCWQLVLLGRRLVELERPSQAVRPLVCRGTLAVGVFVPLTVAVEEFHPLSLPGRAGIVGLAVATFVAVPVVRRSERARRFWTAVAFWARMAALGVRYLLSPATWRRAATAGRRYATRVRPTVRRYAARARARVRRYIIRLRRQYGV